MMDGAASLSQDKLDVPLNADRSAEADRLIPVPFRLLLAIAVRAEESGRIDEAEQLALHILRAAPEEPEALHLAGVVAFRRERVDQAIALVEHAILATPQNAVYLRNLSEMYRVAGRLDDALAVSSRGLALQPADPLALHNQAIIHQERGEPEQVIRCARQAIALKPSMPGPHFAIAEAQLLRGDFAEGWEEYEWRFRLPGFPYLIPPALQQGRPQWDGGDLRGSLLLLIGDQGFGDVIQFSRYIRWAAGRCPRLVMATSIEMAPLLRRLFPRLHIFTNWSECPTFAAYCPISGLPRLHGTRLDTIPSPASIEADAGRVILWKERLDRLVPSGLRRIGLVWAGRATHRNDRNRSMPLSTLAPLAALRGCALVSLQKGEAAGQTAGYQGHAPLIDAGAEIIDFEDTAAVIGALDLVVTVDTSVAHLAAAMGRPCWVMLPYAADWRWLQGRADSPWYPAVRLFRQSEARRWDEVVEAIVEAIVSPS
jgi:Flp pilus assembly protein TadD